MSDTTSNLARAIGADGASGLIRRSATIKTGLLISGPSRAICAVIASAASLTSANAAYAQDSAEAPLPEQGNEIIVTAQGREESLQSVPISVTVTSGEELAKANLTDLPSLTERTAGVKLASAPAADILTIRGIGSGLNPGFEQAVGTFVDGVYRGRARSMRAALFDIDRVEILKGPQTTFFGNNVIAGAFNITTRKPGDTLEWNASALYGSYGQYAVEGGISLPLGDTLSARISGKAYGMDGYIDIEPAGTEGPRQRDWIGRVSLLWNPSDSFESHLRFDRARQRHTNDNLAELLNCPSPIGTPVGLCALYLAQEGGSVDDQLDGVTADYPGSTDYDMSELVWTNTLFMDGFSIISKSAYFHHELDLFGNLFPVPVERVPGFPAILPYYLPEKYTNYSQEIRLVSDNDSPFSYILGGYYSHGKLHTELWDGFYFAPLGGPAPDYAPTDGVGIHGDFDQRDDVYSVFAAGTYELTEALRLNLGLRYSVVKKTAHRFNETGSSGPGVFLTQDNFIPGTAVQQAGLNALLAADPTDFTDPDRTDKKLMPSVSVQYDAAPGVMLYASYTKGFKAGGFADSFLPNTFGPENVDAYEVGMKGEFLDRRLTLNLTGFWSDYSDLQESTNLVLSDGTILQSVQNAASARSRGIELSSRLEASPMVTLYTDIAYLDSEFSAFTNGPCTVIQGLTIPNCVQDLSGKSRPYAPEWSGSAGMNFTIPVTGDNVITFDPSVHFTSSYAQQANNDPLFDQPGYAKIDARLGYGSDDGRWEIALIGKNLTDKITASVRNNVATTPGTIWAVPEIGRSFALQLTLKN